MGRGGSRHGAGRPGWRLKAEQCHRLDVREMYRAGVLKDGRVGNWCWTNSHTGEQSGSVRYSIEGASMALRYSATDTAKVQHVAIDKTPCHFGGARPWFSCPACGDRVAVIYFRSGRFACRCCQRIAHLCQSEDATGRAWRKQLKVEQRLGEDWERPKGMHQTTYDRLLDVLERCEVVKEGALIAALGRLGLLC